MRTAMAPNRNGNSPRGLIASPRLISGPATILNSSGSLGLHKQSGSLPPNKDKLKRLEEKYLRKSPSKKKQRRDNSSTHSRNSRESSAPRTGGGYILEDRDPDLQKQSKISLSASKKKIPPFRETWNSV